MTGKSAFISAIFWDVVRIAHLTDLHLLDQPHIEAGGRRAFQQASDLNSDLILLGGDVIGDAFGHSHDEVEAQWTVYQRLRDEVSLPQLGCIGNHDVWGWDRERSNTTGKEADWGKAWAMRMMGLPRRFYSVDVEGWHIVVLDSTHTGERGEYVAKLDEVQFDWLSLDLAETRLPTLILSHIPILSAAVFFDGDNEALGDWRVPSNWMHIDARRIKNLLHGHPHVRLCLSGHTHLAERVEYLGITYANSGAVCGAWWKGPYQETPPGIGLVDLDPDGTFEWRYVPTEG